MGEDHPPPEAKGVQRLAVFVAGWLAVALGVVGVFVPLLPTTPFLLLAAACFIRSSPRAYCWLMTNRLLGAYIRSYRSGEGVPLRVKVPTLALLWLTIGYSALWVVQNAWIRVLLAVIAVAVTVHIVSMRTAPSEPQEDLTEEDERPAGCSGVEGSADVEA